MTKKTKKKFTVPEFKTWLEGIMQFQDDDWSPNREQWEEIYEKIMNLKEPVSREKMALTENALDEINGIVYDQIREAFSQHSFPQPHAPTSAPLQPGNYNTPGPIDPAAAAAAAPAQPPSNPTPDGLENKSLSELKELTEKKEQALGVQSDAQHKLPDTNKPGIPDDFV